MALTLSDLESMARKGCETPGCDCHREGEPLFLSPRCHAGRGVTVSYRAGTGHLVLRCARYRRLVVEVAVAGLAHATN